MSSIVLLATLASSEGMNLLSSVPRVRGAMLRDEIEKGNHVLKEDVMFFFSGSQSQLDHLLLDFIEEPGVADRLEAVFSEGTDIIIASMKSGFSVRDREFVMGPDWIPSKPFVSSLRARVAIDFLTRLRDKISEIEYYSDDVIEENEMTSLIKFKEDFDRFTSGGKNG